MAYILKDLTLTSDLDSRFIQTSSRNQYAGNTGKSVEELLSVLSSDERIPSSKLISELIKGVLQRINPPSKVSVDIGDDSYELYGRKLPPMELSLLCPGNFGGRVCRFDGKYFMYSFDDNDQASSGGRCVSAFTDGGGLYSSDDLSSWEKVEDLSDAIRIDDMITIDYQEGKKRFCVLGQEELSGDRVYFLDEDSQTGGFTASSPIPKNVSPKYKVPCNKIECGYMSDGSVQLVAFSKNRWCSPDKTVYRNGEAMNFAFSNDGGETWQTFAGLNSSFKPPKYPSRASRICSIDFLNGKWIITCRANDSKYEQFAAYASRFSSDNTVYDPAQTPFEDGKCYSISALNGFLSSETLGPNTGLFDPGKNYHWLACNEEDRKIVVCALGLDVTGTTNLTFALSDDIQGFRLASIPSDVIEGATKVSIEGMDGQGGGGCVGGIWFVTETVTRESNEGVEANEKTISYYMLYSLNGETWAHTKVKDETSGEFVDCNNINVGTIVYGNGTWVAIPHRNSFDSYSFIMKSSNGINWEKVHFLKTDRTEFKTCVTGIVYDETTDMFLVSTWDGLYELKPYSN